MCAVVEIAVGGQHTRTLQAGSADGPSFRGAAAGSTSCGCLVASFSAIGECMWSGVPGEKASSSFVGSRSPDVLLPSSV